MRGSIRRLPDRQPLPRPDIRSMLRPLGPVVVFGASNFPLAFSVAGGDTASALAAGCPVIVKAHPAHPGTSESSPKSSAKRLRRKVCSRRFFAGLRRRHRGRDSPGEASTRPRSRVHRLAARRPRTHGSGGHPARSDPCFTEMSSGNPVFHPPRSASQRTGRVGCGLFGSFTLGAGQFCTKPGIVLVPIAGNLELREGTGERLVDEAQPYTLLTPGIAREYSRATQQRAASAPLAAEAAKSNPEHRAQCDAQSCSPRARRILAQAQLWRTRSSDRILCWFDAIAPTTIYAQRVPSMDI